MELDLDLSDVMKKYILYLNFHQLPSKLVSSSIVEIGKDVVPSSQF